MKTNRSGGIGKEDFSERDIRHLVFRVFGVFREPLIDWSLVESAYSFANAAPNSATNAQPSRRIFAILAAKST